METDKQGKMEQIALWDFYEALIFVPPWGLVSLGVIKEPGGKERALGLQKTCCTDNFCRTLVTVHQTL